MGGCTGAVAVDALGAGGGYPDIGVYHDIGVLGLAAGLGA